MSHPTRLLGAFLLPWLSACGVVELVPITSDASTREDASLDSGLTDTGLTDTGLTDTGLTDTGSLPERTDAGLDAGELAGVGDVRHLLVLMIGMCFIYFSNRHTLRQAVGLDGDRPQVRRQGLRLAQNAFLAAVGLRPAGASVLPRPDRRPGRGQAAVNRSR